MAKKAQEEKPASSNESKKVQAIIDAISKSRKTNHLLSSLDVPDWELVPLNDPELDALLGGGFAMGRMYSIESLFSGGKSTLILETIAKVLNKYPTKYAYLADVEGTLDREYAAYLIGEPWHEGRVIIDPSINGQEIVNTAIDLMESGAVAIIAIDSWAAIETPTEQKADEIGNQSVGALARFGTDVLKFLKNSAAQNNVLFLMANQLRVNITPMGARGNNASGGRAAVFYPDVRIELTKPNSKDDTRIATIIKSKTAAQVQATCTFSVVHNYGIDRIQSLVNYFIRCKSSWFLMGANKWYTIIDPETGEVLLKGQGEKFYDLLRNNSELLTRLCHAHSLPIIEARDFLQRKQQIAQIPATDIDNLISLEPAFDNH